MNKKLDQAFFRALHGRRVLRLAAGIGPKYPFARGLSSNLE